MWKMSIVCIACLCMLCITFCYAQQEEQKMIMPKKAEIDTDYDGVIDRVEWYDDNAQMIKVESDNDGNGAIDEWVYYEAGKPIKSERDTNGDGKPDVWMQY